MTSVRCPVCGSSHAIHHFASPLHEEGQWSIERCLTCGLYLLKPRPAVNDLHKLYPELYVPFQPPPSGWLRRWMYRRHYGLRANAVERAQPTAGRLLDIGCGAGGFVGAFAHKRGWHAIGCDMSRQALRVARQRGVAAFGSEGAALALANHSCDVVTLWEVIEHLPEPRTALREVARVLKPGGVLLLSTPNGASWQAHFWKKLWFSWDIPRHLQIFTPDTLWRLLHETGFTIIGREAFPLERFVAVMSAQRSIALHWPEADTPSLRRLIVLLGIACWPILRLIDYAPGASGLALVAVRNGQADEGQT